MRKLCAGLMTVILLYFVNSAASLAQSVEELQARLTELEKQLESLEKTAATKDLKIRWRGAPELSSADGRFKMKLRGRLYFDYGHVSVKDRAGLAMPALNINNAEVRAARFGIQGVIFKNIEYKFESNFSGTEVNVKEASLRYILKPLSIKVGQFKQMNALEEQTSSRFITFMERAGFTDAFGLTSRVGIAVKTGGSNWTISAGYFFEDIANIQKNDDNLFAARLTFAPEIRDQVKLHLGASFFTRSKSGEEYEQYYDQRPHNHQASKFLQSEKFRIISETFFGLEAAAMAGPFSAQAEWGWMKNSRAENELNSNADPEYSGGYISLSYFLTGEERSYSAEKASFGRVRVRRPVNEGGMGAVQLALRYDVVDLTHEIFGERQDIFLLGANFYLNDYARIMMNYAHSTVENHRGMANNIINSFGLRFQADW